MAQGWWLEGGKKKLVLLLPLYRICILSFKYLVTDTGRRRERGEKHSSTEVSSTWVKEVGFQRLRGRWFSRRPSTQRLLILPPRLPRTWLAICRGSSQQCLFLDLFLVANRGNKAERCLQGCPEPESPPLFSVTHNHGGVEVCILRHYFSVELAPPLVSAS